MRLPGFTAATSLDAGRLSWQGEDRYPPGEGKVIPQLQCWGWEWGFACCTAGFHHYCLRCDLFDCSITEYPSGAEFR
ncbi:MAG TPA: hypothetical protein VG860_07215 [Terriglobia bacterium]|jgi:hypothetical protein|nr:hypothetical protein [Terriglobia bacterium]